MRKIIPLFILVLGFASCSPIVHKNITKPLTPRESTTDVAVYDVGEMVPENTEVIGNIRITDSGFTTHCDWETILEKAMNEARAAGGNGLEILQHSYPNGHSSCHQIAANILNIDPNCPPKEPSEFAQKNYHDYVILSEGDTTQCLVIDETKNMLSIVYEVQGVTRKAQLDKSKILAYHIDDPIALADLQYQKNKKVFHVRFGFDGGYAFRTARLADGLSNDYKDYLRELSKGPVMGANLRINIDKMYSLGIHYDRFTSSNSGYFYAYDDYGNYHEGLISSNHNINFIAASAGYHFTTPNEKHCFFFDYLLGYMNYHAIESDFGTDYIIEGATIGMGLTFDYDYMLSKHIGIGAGMSYYNGALSKAKVNGNEQNLNNNKEGLQRFNLKAGIRFYL